MGICFPQATPSERMVTLYNLTPPPTDIGCPVFAHAERDIPLGDSASVTNLILYKEHVERLREMVASKEKLSSFFCSSEGEHEVPKTIAKLELVCVQTIEFETKGKCCELKDLFAIVKKYFTI